MLPKHFEFKPNAFPDQDLIKVPLSNISLMLHVFGDWVVLVCVG